MPRVVVYLRFARPRAGIKDPPAVQWDAAKERELWSMLRASSTDLDWAALARHFDVSLVYVLQQAAWLYEKELGLLRRKMSQINMPPADSPVQSQLQRLMRESSESPSRGDSRGDVAVASPSASLSLDDFEDSGSDVAPAPSRRLLSTSRIAPMLANSDSASDSDSSMDAFLPARHAEPAAPSDLSSSFSDNSVSQSALEEALLEQVKERRRLERDALDSPQESAQESAQESPRESAPQSPRESAAQSPQESAPQSPQYSAPQSTLASPHASSRASPRASSHASPHASLHASQSQTTI